ncbi:endonuclease domain-containing protein [Corynebacterium atrinae]|uniref:endonuclease domain-containing protein n=1 Tax=Corynebacterium atrinae TaxID=1336740 RepID=UPI0025B47B73|nr:DUF559 domain-containing protein [Corynebacterium atrinae]
MVDNGVSRHQVHRLVAEGQMFRVERGVFTTSKPEGTLLLQALRYRRPHLIFTGRTVIELLTEAPLTRPIVGIVRPEDSNHSNSLITVKRRRQVEFEEHRGLSITPPAVAVADALGEVEEDKLLDFLESAYSTRKGKQKLEEDLRGFPRVPEKLRSLINQAAIGADSLPEQQVFRELRRHGLKVVQNPQIGGYFFDGVIEKSKIIVEIDGYAYHSAEFQETFVRDRWKQNLVTRQGYRVLRYSGSCVMYHLDKVVEQIVAAAHRHPAPLSSETSPVWVWHETYMRNGPLELGMAQ